MLNSMGLWHMWKQAAIGMIGSCTEPTVRVQKQNAVLGDARGSSCIQPHVVGIQVMQSLLNVHVRLQAKLQVVILNSPKLGGRPISEKV